MSEAASRLLGVLERHISQINARVIFSRALKAHGLDEARLKAGDTRPVIQSIERSLQIFVSPSARARVMEELWAAAGGQPSTPKALVPVNDESDVGRARLMARSMCLDLGVESYTLQRIATAVSELARNISKYAKGGGSVELRVEEEPRRFVIVAMDGGPGIPNLDEVMSGGYRSKTGMGLGLLGTKRMVDRFEIQTGSGGTRVLVEVNL